VLVSRAIPKVKDFITFRVLRQVQTTAVSVAVISWFSTFGPLSAILAWMFGKHVLVSLFVMELHSGSDDA
jgi:hypothetical protein